MTSGLALLLALGLRQGPALLSNDSIRTLAAARTRDPRIPGLVVGRLAESGTLRLAEGTGITSSSVFEIGSITKVFTSLLLAEMTLRGEVSLDDPVAKYVPPGSTVPSSNGVAITLRHLATHTSGLPRLPANLAPADWDDPYADYGERRLLEFLASHQLRRTPGTQYEYSNLGAGLLGYALARRAGGSYAELVRTRIFRPLGMDRSVVAEQDTRVRPVAGYDAMGDPASPWHFDVLVGAGGVRSTLDDMLRFAEAARDTVRGPLTRAMALTQREHFRVDSTLSIGLGWHRRTRAGTTMAWHNGGTGGFRSMLVANPSAGRAGVVLASSALSQDELGLALLDPAVSVPPLPPPRPTVPVDPNILAKLAGTYRIAPTFAITITPRGDRGLYLQATGQQRIRLYPSSATEFFIIEAAVSITFERDSAGTVTALVLHQGGTHQRAMREK